jgi:hypothetical protein
MGAGLRARLWSGSPGVTPASPLDLPVLTTTVSRRGHLSGLAMTVGDQLVQDVGMVEHGHCSSGRWG